MENDTTEAILRSSIETGKVKTVVAIITARGGSKGLPRKNIKQLCGKPLIAHSISAALGCALVDRCIVSTEDAEIKAVSLKWGAEVVDRPASLATDTSLSRDVVRQVLGELASQQRLPEYFVLLQPTSPLRTDRHLTEAIEQFFASGKASAVSVTEMEHHPYKCFKVIGDEWMPVIDYETLEAPRQTLPRMYRPNGAIYLLPSSAFLKEGAFFVPPVHPYIMNRESSIDIDDAADLFLAEMLLSKIHI